MADQVGTAVAKTPKATVYDKLVRPTDPFNDRKQAFEIASIERQTNMIQGALRAVANSSWGNQMPDPKLQEAMCIWALNKGVDVATHIHILGGRPYLNAQYYIDRLTTLPAYRHSRSEIIGPLSERTPPAKVFDAKSIAQLKKKTLKVNMKRWALQEHYEIPEEINAFPKTSAVVVVYIEMFDRNGEVVVFDDWGKAGSYGRKSKGRNAGKPVDPVGDGDPVKTATTRAYRACCKTIPNFPLDDTSKDGELTELNERIEAQRQERKAREAEQAEGDARHHLIVQVREMLDDPHVDPVASDACRIIYEDWIAGAFQNVTIEQIQQVANELQGSKQEIAQNGLCLMCDASIDEGEPHGEDCPTRLSVIEDVVDGVTGEVIEEARSD